MNGHFFSIHTDCSRAWAVGFFLIMASATLAVDPIQQATGQQTREQTRGSRRNSASLLESTQFVRGLSEQELVQWVPTQSGLNYVDCPNCNRGRQENQLSWTPEQPNEVVCRYCDHRYPSKEYPANERLEVKTPTGTTAVYPYWVDSNGYRHFFPAKRDDLVRAYLAQQARDLASLYVSTQDKALARRSAIIVLRFAEVFPSWCFHYDYPFRQKEVYNGPVDPKNFRSGYRTARWTWWAYSDVPTLLIQAYDDIRDSGALEELSRERGIDAAAIIESNLIREACEQVIANEDQLTNMSPTAWRGLIGAGKTIREPRYVHEPVRRLKRFVETQFFYDGMWSEGSPDYGSQSVGGLEQVLQQLKGYSDPPNYIDSIDGRRFDALDLSNDFVALKLARDALSKMRLPNGRAVPVHDTWPTSQRGSTSKTEPYLLPALGHACLGGGQAEHQTQFHLTWSGGYGHSHGDNLSLMLFADQREQLSDLGYTHTAYRSWTLATSAHNTVVIDGKNQDLGNKESPTDGALQWFDVSNEHVQVVRASGEKGYPGLAQLYSRSLIVIQIDERRYYAVDMFDVMGGDQHDYFLHGDADVNMQIGSSEGFTPIDTLLPSGMKWIPTRNEGETGKIKEPYYAYGFLRDLSSKRLSSDQTEFVTIRPSGESTSGLRLALLTQRDSQLVLGKNPSIRRAAEDDAKLEEYQRPFMMLRQNSASTLSRFVTVVEPFLGTPTIQSIERVQSTEAELAIKVQLQNRVDLIVVRAKTPVEFNAGPSKASFVGELGVLTLVNPNANANTTRGFAIAGRWRHGEYELKSPKPVEAKLMAVDSEGLLVRGINLTVPPPGTVVRIKTLDDWVYPFTLQQSTLLGDGLRLQVREVAAIDFDLAKKRFQLRSFPQREHQGDVMVEWVVPESSRR